MKRIINGRKYDTSTARLVGDQHNTYDIHDFSYCIESLYRKQNGEFFLHGEGGPLSKYSRRCGTNERSGSEELIPLTEDKAKEWVEENLDGDIYEELFGEVAE